MERGAESPVVASPTPEQVLGWIAAARETWFPARYALAAGISRDSLDRPINELRAAELIRVVDWVRGVGQGYALTEDGQAAAFGRPREPEPAPLPPPAIEPPQAAAVERPPVVTPALVYANLLWYFIGLVVVTRWGHSLKRFLLEGDLPVLERLGAASAPDLLAGEWWRLATCCFAHGSIWHLLVNAASLVTVGAVVEHLWGRWRTFILYLIAGFAGSCLAFALHPLDPTGRVPVVLVGASGALCGLLASVFAWILLYHRRLEPGVAPELLRRLSVGAALIVAVSMLPGVSWEAHLGGAAGGFLAAFLLDLAGSGHGRRRTIGILLVAMMPGTCLAGLLLSMRYGESWEPFRMPAPPPALPDPNPHLNAVSPEGVRRGVAAATALLISTPEKRKPERVNEVRVEIAGLQANAAMAIRLLEASTGDAAVDADRAKARAFAEARRESLGKLLGMIDAKTIPSVETWKAWGESHAAANRLWDGLPKRE